MTNSPVPSADASRLERTYAAPPEQIWDLWTTAAGIESWWAPDGFRTDVKKLDVRNGGELVYEMTAVAPEQKEFMSAAGLQMTTESRKTFTEVDRPHRLAYRSHVDFVPDREPYEHLTVVEIQPEGEGTRVAMTVDPMHDEEWTARVLAGRNNELDKLAEVVRRQGS